jgi:hypothetical protein
MKKMLAMIAILWLGASIVIGDEVTLSGTVTVAGSEQPIGMVKVDVMGSGPQGERLIGETTYTDASGKYTFRLIMRPGDEGKIIFEKAGFETKSIDFIVPSDKELTLDAALVWKGESIIKGEGSPQPGDEITLSGIVTVAGSEQPVGMVKVDIMAGGVSLISEVIYTGPDGRYIFPLTHPPYPYPSYPPSPPSPILTPGDKGKIIFEKAGFETKSIDFILPPGKDLTLDVALVWKGESIIKGEGSPQPGDEITLSGIVTVAGSEQPVGMVKVDIMAGGVSLISEVIYTGPDGRYIFPLTHPPYPYPSYPPSPPSPILTPGDKGKIIFEKAGFETKSIDFILPPGKDLTLDVALVWKGEGTLKGKVTQGGKGVKDSCGNIVLTPSGDSGQTITQTICTDAEGNYAVKVTAGIYDIRFSFPNASTEVVKNVEIKADEETVLNVEVKPYPLLRGKVTDKEGKPLAKVELAIKKGNLFVTGSRTDEEGNYKCYLDKGVGKYTLTAYYDAANYHETFEVEIKEGENIFNIVLELDGNVGSLWGYVRSSSSKRPIENVVVQLTTLKSYYEGITNAKGGYSIKEITPGKYTAIFLPPQPYLPTTREIEIKVGQNKLVVHLKAAEETIVDGKKDVVIEKDNCKLEIPKGAVGKKVKVTVAEVDKLVKNAIKTYRFEVYDAESGEKIEAFLKEVKITFGYNDAGVDEKKLELITSPNGLEWEKVENVTIDTDKNEVVLKVKHFSYYALVAESGRAISKIEVASQGDGLSFPNPVASGARLSLRVTQPVKIKVYNILGQLVQELDANGEVSYWDGRDARGQKLPSGIYFYQLQVDRKLSPSKKMMILR